MTITKVNPPGWPAGGKLTSAQANAFDTKLITALDKTGDTVSSGTITWGTGATLVIADAATLTISTLSASLTGKINIPAPGYINVATGGLIQFAAGGLMTMGGTQTVTGAGLVQTSAGGRIKLGDSDWLQLNTRTYSRYFPFANVVVPSGTANWSANIDGLKSAAAGAQIRFSLPTWLQDGATLASVDLLVFPAPGAHGSSVAHSVTIYKRTVAAGSGIPSWTSIGSESISAAGWGDGNVKTVSITVGSVISAGDQIAIDIFDETAGAGTYPVGGVYNVYLGASLNFSIAELRPA